jgi:hypothetical protein
MKTQVIEQKYLCINALTIDSIVFDDTDQVSLWCITVIEGQQTFARVDCTFAQLNDILMNCDETGRKLSLHLAEILNGPFDIPSMVEVKENFGYPLSLKGFDIIIQEDDNGLLLNNLHYRLDKFYPINRFIPDGVNETDFADTFLMDTVELAQLFYDYKNALEHGYQESTARQMFGLDNRLFFEMATKAAEVWKI